MREVAVHQGLGVVRFWELAHSLCSCSSYVSLSLFRSQFRSQHCSSFGTSKSVVLWRTRSFCAFSPPSSCVSERTIC
jgi:hypothetical protein